VPGLRNVELTAPYMHNGSLATLRDVVNGPVEYVDTRNNKRAGKVFLKPTNTVVGGVAFGQPYAAPFSVR